jgi:hypothetical protein
VAPLTAAARAARIDAKRLRSESNGLKLAVRGNLARSREGLGRAQVEAEKARVRRAIPFASPWSGLEWCCEDEQLNSVLVPVD